MGITLHRNSHSVWEEPTQDKRNPDPKNYIIIQTKVVNNILIAWINYPNCTNYEGNKILVFKNVTLEELTSTKIIDPHFTNSDKTKIKPIARFEPTETGWDLAITLAAITKDH